MARTDYRHVIQATGFDAPDWGQVRVIRDGLFCLDDEGDIAAIVTPDDPSYGAIVENCRKASRFTATKPGQYLLPGFVDLHVHAPQWMNMGKALHLPLEVWLQECTFPLETQMANLDTAAETYRDLVRTTLMNGTTTVLYFGTQNLESSLTLGTVCAQAGQRACIGKIAMDNPDECPPDYRDESPADAIGATERFIAELPRRSTGMKNGLTPVIMPRFTPSCTDETLAGLGALAQKYNVPIHTHLAESNWIKSYAQQRFGCSDTQAMADFGLLTARSVLAHATMLSDEDAALLAQHGSSVAHCPISNVFFSDAVYPVRRRFAQGVNAGLGTDISGGFSPSLYDNIRQCVIASRMLENGVDADVPPERRGVANSRIDYRHAFYMATTGGGKALGLPVGRFAPGFAFDAQLVDVGADGSSVRIFDGYDSDEDALQKILFLASPCNIVGLWVQGRQLVGPGEL